MSRAEPTPQPRAPVRRADAELNRVRILDAARAALAISGEATMQSIARSAGIGQGTIYRHFPTRESLVLAVHRNDVAELVAAAPSLLAEHPPLIALRLWFDKLAEYGRIKQGLAGALHSVMRQQLSDEGYDSTTGAIALLLDAGKATGQIRSDIDEEEVLLLVGFLWRINNDADREARSRHLLDLVMDSIRTVGSAGQAQENVSG
ncbi:TetR/AcrR family transcriptional regulator [Glaciihabitans sp. dw_435]|uniref:TetR/AcrR family transcriptional regulator n=1 Tax=Glaciihabitans sp. dw_435 TaxID=2720081 RepID=UPI001BD6A008|nr:TetR/AcrR family transcriptional regulator [Glaciihabitans sp. dw_435]